MLLGYIVLTTCYYSNVFNGRDIKWMSNSLFGLDGKTYDQSAVIGSDYKLDHAALEHIGLPRYTTTYAISQLCYNLSLGSAVRSLIFVFSFLFSCRIGHLYLSLALEGAQSRCVSCVIQPFGRLTVI